FALAGEVAAADPAGLRLLEVYLDRRVPDWREGFRRRRDEAARAAGSLGEGEALAALGLGADADRRAILDAHRRLMKDAHPDRGGSAAEAARLNAARDLLLGRGARGRS
ncbi:MAG: molecular chaperone DnaJ, partial [Hyphomicrobiales bacterium]|nr:molecular chaperone DnaJ [Hyphomicrobiales bacterium]